MTISQHGGGRRDANLRAIAAPDRVRREALARCLCARICDERRGIETLEALDQVLTRFENETTAPMSLVDLLRNDRYAEGEGDEIEQLKRHTWNAAMAHATAIVRAELGLVELRRQSQWPDEEFDLGGES